jgi:hypothetical protein
MKVGGDTFNKRSNRWKKNRWHGPPSKKTLELDSFRVAATSRNEWIVIRDGNGWVVEPIEFPPEESA